MEARSCINDGLGWNETEDSAGAQRHVQNLYQTSTALWGLQMLISLTFLRAGEVECQTRRQKGWD